ncbi:restriction endonuclease subunit S [Micrococcus luteus]|uniref:restriction endonuclease subunit S n=1 Tax=Micrococcus luteus TaxID=1270 RepID=UPI0033B40486
MTVQPLNVESSVPLSSLADVVLGKMLQPRAQRDGDVEVPYLRSASIQDSELDLGGVKRMWASPLEAVALDLRAGDVVVSEGGSVGRAAVLREDLPGVIFQNSVNRLRPRHGVDGRFLAYVLSAIRHSGYFSVYCDAVSIAHLTAEKLGRLRIPAADADAQQRIADYLDRETAAIDALIDKQRGLVAGLRRRRATAIVAATSGMQANGDRGESASSWLKDMPAHWSELPIKRVLTDVQSGYWGSDEVGDGTDVRVVRVADFDRPTLSVGTAPTIRSVTPSERAKAALRRGDLLMEKSGGTGINPVGFVVSYESDEESIFANFIVRLRPRPDQHARFWLYALNGAYTSGLTWKSVNQTTGIQNLDMASFMSEVFPVPPLDEQREIADHLDRETAKIDALIAKAERFIELAQERRAALITAAVTVQIEIPTED